VNVLILPLLPVAGAGVLLLLGDRARLVGVVAVGTLLLTLALAIAAAMSEPSFGWAWSPVIQLRLGLQGFGRTMSVLVPLIATPIVAYAAATEDDGRRRLLALLLAFVGAMLLLVSAADFLTLLIGWELVSFLSWALIGHRWRDPDAVRSAAQAFLTTRVGDIGLFIAAGMTFAATGSFAFAGLAEADSGALAVVAAGVLLAAAAKSAQLPFSPWLFAAMAGPTPVSALLHSATMVAAGAYLLIRLGPEFVAVAWFLPAVATVGIATALAGGVVALVQTDAKRALAGSTSAQYGLMFVAVGAGSVAAAGAQLVAHAAFKSLLFLGAGVAIHATGSGWLDSLRLARALPRVALLSAVGALALAAVPPLGAAWSKEQILAAAVDASPWLGAGMLLGSFLTALYAARYQLLAFGAPDASAGPRASNQEAVGDAHRYRPSKTELASLGVLAFVTLLLSAVWLPGADRFVESMTGGALEEGAAWELTASVAVIAFAFVLVWQLIRRGRLLTLGLPERLQVMAADWLGVPTATHVMVVRPIEALAAALARLDDRVIDAGVRGVAWLARRVSALASIHGEWTFDGIVRGLATLTLGTARASGATDDLGVDAAVEAGARSVGVAGEASRRLQTGESHHYYVIIAVGLAVMLVVLLWSP